MAKFTAEELKQTIQELTGWKVITKEIDSKVKCKCGFIGKAKIINRQGHILIYNCPKCNLLAPTPIIGQDIKLKKVRYL